MWVVRHGEVAHYRGDVGLTARGVAQARAAGQQLAPSLEKATAIRFLSSSSRRAIETAEGLRRSARAAARDPDSNLRWGEVVIDPALRNVGLRLRTDEDWRGPDALHDEFARADLVEALPPEHLDYLERIQHGPDPMGYWLSHTLSDVAEPPTQAVGRVRKRLVEILEASTETAYRWVLVTHSGVMRAVLASASKHGPGGGG